MRYTLIWIFILVAILVLAPGSLAFDPVAMLLSFVLSMCAMIVYPNSRGMIAVAIWLILAAMVSIRHLGWARGLLMALAYLGGYIAVLFAYSARERTGIALDRSEALVAELQETQRSLRAYVRRAEELAVAGERNRVAREMHDVLGHRLTVASVQLEGAQRLISSDPERATQMIETVREQVRDGLGELRRTVATLRAVEEIDLPLNQALARLVTDFEDSTGLVTHLVLEEELPPLPDTHRVAIYRVAQEALTNVQRHAQAGEVWVSLDSQDGQLALAVSDDGVGLPEKDERVGFGLLGIQERAAQLGGTFALSPRPGGGTCLVFGLPLPEEGPDER